MTFKSTHIHITNTFCEKNSIRVWPLSPYRHLTDPTGIHCASTLVWGHITMLSSKEPERSFVTIKWLFQFYYTCWLNVLEMGLNPTTTTTNFPPNVWIKLAMTFWDNIPVYHWFNVLGEMTLLNIKADFAVCYVSWCSQLKCQTSTAFYFHCIWFSFKSPSNGKFDLTVYSANWEVTVRTKQSSPYNPLLCLLFS